MNTRVDIMEMFQICKSLTLRREGKKSKKTAIITRAFKAAAQSYTLSTFSLERLKSLSLHSYTAPSTPADTSLVSSGSHAKLLTFPLWPLCSRHTCMSTIQLYMSNACDAYDSRDKLGVIRQPRQAPHHSIMPPVLKIHLILGE